LRPLQAQDAQTVAVPAPAARHQLDPGNLRFDDPQLAFAAHSNLQILRSLAVFSACSIKPLVKHADTCLAWSKKVFGAGLVNGVVKRTFFKHFCAGGLPPTGSYFWRLTLMSTPHHDQQVMHESNSSSCPVLQRLAVFMQQC
jgi:hypothetical protein